MSDIRRVDPRRPYQLNAGGVRRIVLGDKYLGEPPAPTSQHTQHVKQKPLRIRVAAKRWLMAVAHTNRGKLSAHARQAIAAAAILAAPSQGVVAVVLGELTEDAGAMGADHVVVLTELDAAAYQPERSLAAIQDLIEKYNAQHVFIPDQIGSDGDLGRRLIVTMRAPSATHVVEINAKSVSAVWLHGTETAVAALPRIVLLEAGAVDADLPFIGIAERVEADSRPGVDDNKTAYRDLGIESTGGRQIPLEEADFVVAAGNGVANIATFKALASALGATMGASRVAVDDGRFARDLQIGASGKTVSATGRGVSFPSDAGPSLGPKTRRPGAGTAMRAGDFGRRSQLVEGPVAGSAEDELAERLVTTPRGDRVLAEGLDVPESLLKWRFVAERGGPGRLVQ